MGVGFLSQIAGVFGTGVLASVSPCVYPMLPITIGFLGSHSEARGGKLSVVLYALGQTLALFVVGIVAVQIGETLGFSSQSREVQVGIGLFLLVAGLISWKGRLPAFVTRWFGGGILARNHLGRGLLSAFLFGVSAALIASPCTSPILGGVLALMATSATFEQGMLLMLSYSLGFSLLFLLLGLGVVRLGRLPRSGPWLNRMHKFSSVILLIAGVYYLAQAFA